MRAPRRTPRRYFVALAVIVGAAGVRAQAPLDPPSTRRLEDYLEHRGLDSLLGAHYRRLLKSPNSEEQARAAERLGRLYARQLAQPSSADRRDELQRLATELLATIPESQGLELRLDLAKAAYLRAESIGERSRLALATREEAAEALAILRPGAGVLDDIANLANTRLDALEREQRRERADAAPADEREQIAYYRRIRSLASYYAGWTAYYLALLESPEPHATQALVHFGKVLNAPPGRPATIERLPRALLIHEHVGRAALGCALATALQGKDLESVRWLDAVEECPDLPAAVADQLFSRRVVVYAAANRWSDVLVVARRQRPQGEDERREPLAVLDARLLAVSSLAALKDPSLKPYFREDADRAAQLAFADLIARGENSHVLDLVARFGTAPIASEGFVAQYVRGIHAFEHAKSLHQAAASDTSAPCDVPEVVNAYREAARLLEIAVASPDAPSFEREWPRARTRQGLALFLASQFSDAAKVFEAAFQGATDASERADALWYAIVALDTAVEHGTKSLRDDRDRLALLFLREFPASENAARLLLRQQHAELLGDEETIRVLSEIPATSPLFDAARRQLTRLHYRQYRQASPSERPFAANRFADLALGVLRDELGRAQASSDKSGGEAAQNVVLLARQLLDALLSLPAPDLARVDECFSAISTASLHHSMDLRALSAELAYRRLQVALARGTRAEIDEQLGVLQREGGQFDLAARRLLYSRALAGWRDVPASTQAARELVRHGLVVLGLLARSETAQLASVRENVAAAAFLLWTSENDTLMRDKALELDRLSSDQGARTTSVLARLAVLLELAGDAPGALQAWRDLLSAREPDTPEWFEARYHSLRLLGASDPRAAREALEQFKALHESMGPEPWGTLMVQLDASLPAAAVPTPPAGAPK